MFCTQYTPGVDIVRASKKHLDEGEICLAKKVFQSCDEGQKGYLNRQDYKVASVNLLGYKPSKFEVDRIFENAEKTHDGETFPGLRLPQFLEVMTAKLTAVDEQEEIRQIFMAFDTHCQGFITKDDFERAVAKVAPHMAKQTARLDAFFKEIDRDADGRVSYRDFEFMMSYNTADL